MQCHRAPAPRAKNRCNVGQQHPVGNLNSISGKGLHSEKQLNYIAAALECESENLKINVQLDIRCRTEPGFLRLHRPC